MKRVGLTGAIGVVQVALLPLVFLLTRVQPGADALFAAAAPAAVSLLLALAVYLTSLRLWTEQPRAVLATAAVLMLLFWPGWLGWLGSSLVDGVHETWARGWLSGLSLLTAAACVWAARGRVPDGLPRAVLAFGSVLLVLQLAGWRATAPESPELPVPSIERPAERPPDVFFLVLDKYTGRRSLARNYGLDIRDFEQELRSRGFVVPAAARANYALTITALASMLNWTYLHEVPEVDPASRRYSDVFPLIERNRTFATFRQLGYEIHFLPTPFDATRRNRTADVEWRPPGRAPGQEMQVDWIMGTAFGVAMTWYCRTQGCGEEDAVATPYHVETAEELEWKLELLPTLDSTDGRPIFVFAHLLLPHEPYVLDANCDPVDPAWPVSDDDPRIATLYPEQIECLNRMLLRLADKLLARPGGPPVIILQSDHGHGRLFVDLRRGAVRSREEAGRVRVEERFDIFAAYRVPSPGHPIPADTVTPINVVPFVLNALFDAGIPLRENRGYWSVYRYPYAFERQY